MARDEVKTRRFSRAEYDRLIELGVFQPGEPIELIGGELMVAEPQGAPHYTAIQKTAKVLERAFGPGWTVRSQGAHPSRPVLTVEVAESSLAIDRHHKGSVYARAGLADYWVLDLVDRVLEVYREPAPDRAARFGWRYARREVLDASGRVAPLAAPSATIRIGELLP